MSKKDTNDDLFKHDRSVRPRRDRTGGRDLKALRAFEKQQERAQLASDLGCDISDISDETIRGSE